MLRTWCQLTHNDRKHLHGLPLAAVDLCSLPSTRVGVEFNIREADGGQRAFALWRVEGPLRRWEGGRLIQHVGLFPLDDRWQRRRQGGQWRERSGGLLKLAAGLDAVPQLGLPRLFPAPQAVEHAAVQQQHDGTGDEEGAHRRVQDVVVIFQFALARVSAWHVVDAEDDRWGHGQGHDPGGRQQHRLPQVHVLPVIVEWD